MAKRTKKESGPAPQDSSQVESQVETASPKVGSDVGAAQHFADHGDFGIKASKAKPGQQTDSDDSDLEARPLGSREGPSADRGNRDSGVGAPNSGPGSGSGGDLDPDFVGVGTGSGLAASGERRTTGPDITESAIDSMGGDRPARGDNTLHPGTHGAGDAIDGSTVDRGDRDENLGTDTASAAEAPVADDDLRTTSSNGDRASGEDVDDLEAQFGTDE